MPWSILEKTATTIKKLEMRHCETDHLSKYFCPPTAQDIRRVRSLCPNLEQLTTDIRFDSYRIDCDLLSELAQFDTPIRIKLYAHCSWIQDCKLDWFFCYEEFKKLINIRRQKHLPITEDLVVEFKRVRSYEKLKEMNIDADVSFLKKSYRHITSIKHHHDSRNWFTCTIEQQNNYAKCSPGTLTHVRNKLLMERICRLALGVKLRKDTLSGGRAHRARELLKGVRKQQERNEYNRRALRAFGPDTTLFDQWTQE